MSDGLIQTRITEGVSPQPFKTDRPITVPEQSPFDRPLAAVRRYKWLIAAITIVASLAGVVAVRLIAPAYEVRATIWVAVEPQRNSDRVGPIRSAELLSSSAWIDLFRSYRVVDAVVRGLALYVSPASQLDKPFFRDFMLADRFVPGEYMLVADQSAKRWILSRGGVEVERGPAQDSVGRRVGFRWQLPASAFEGSGERKILFTVVTPREKSLELLDRVETRLPFESNFLSLTFSDADATLARRTLNAWVNEFVQVAADLKKHNVAEFARILEEQLRFAEKATQEAEAAYQSFRVNTIILPTEGGPVAAGVSGGAVEGDPALASFFEQKIEYDNLRHDREALEQTIASASTGVTPYEGVLFIPSVAQGPGAEALRGAFTQLYNLQADLRMKKQTFTDAHPAVVEVNEALESLRNKTIPNLAHQLLAQLRERENDYQRRILAASRELREIPPRTIEERRLSRAVAVSEGLYTNLKTRFAEAQLAEASTTPDISILDTAVAPLAPTKNNSAMMLLMAVFSGLGAALALAIVLDQLDGRFRYAHQAVSDLGLVIGGAVPRIPKGGINTKSPEQVIPFVESFRTLRMHVLHSVPGDRITLAVTSAAPGDGKSLISTNLALSFAESGLKTVLIDGDTRRGTLHRTHGLTIAKGLTEYLAGVIDEVQAVRATAYPNLALISCGARHRGSPELLTSPRLKQLVDRLSRSFDVVIFDTPPLAAGIDGYAISAVAGRVLMVLRMGETQRRLASAKLSVLDRLPVEVVGAVLNAVPLTGEFQYYAYSPGYGVVSGESAELIGTTS